SPLHSCGRPPPTHPVCEGSGLFTRPPPNPRHMRMGPGAYPPPSLIPPIGQIVLRLMNVLFLWIISPVGNLIPAIPGSAQALFGCHIFVGLIIGIGVGINSSSN